MQPGASLLVHEGLADDAAVHYLQCYITHDRAQCIMNNAGKYAKHCFAFLQLFLPSSHHSWQQHVASPGWAYVYSQDEREDTLIASIRWDQRAQDMMMAGSKWYLNERETS